MRNEFCSSIPGAPLVTIIVPTIGRPEYILDTLRSVAAQTYSRLQILVSDNAPQVSTLVLLAQAGIADERIEVVERAERLPFSAHMNACIAEARGTYLMILSDDDQITPGYIAEMVDLMTTHPEIAVCLGRQIKTTERDRGVISQPVFSEPQLVMDGIEYLKGIFTGALQTSVMTYFSMLARKEDLVRFGGFKNYPDGSHADNFLLFNMALCGRVALASNIMFYRVYRGSSGLRTSFSSLYEATSAYTVDCARLLETVAGGMKDKDRRLLLRSLKSSNTWLLLSRILHVYRHNLSPVAVLGCLLQVVRFLFLPIPRH